ncbi:hypothetical protein BS47DRAFT_1350496 [Hydnum rufescens UP504]|uniref:Uncharacterized protein n=1 Tax=Hydnum rufescens UP504 TaxID=1448309 RepID=A0A9P6DRC4_9AGAM|nr:hypothetical protein BS47DRAFT_1350496 [Hydnum rufescens UP504]
MPLKPKRWGYWASPRAILSTINVGGILHPGLIIFDVFIHGSFAPGRLLLSQVLRINSMRNLAFQCTSKLPMDEGGFGRRDPMISVQIIYQSEGDGGPN